MKKNFEEVWTCIHLILVIEIDAIEAHERELCKHVNLADLVYI